MATNEQLIPIPGRLHSLASEGHVAGADEIYDDTQEKLQSEINADVKVMGASGTNHSKGLVPDPGATAGTTKYLREDGTWQEVSALPEVEIGETAPTEDVKLFVDEDADPAVSIDVYTRAQVDAKIADTVHLSAQTLTEAQKAQARTNIGVVGSGFQMSFNTTTGYKTVSALGTATVAHNTTTGITEYTF